MKLRYVQQEGSATVEIWTENDEEARMLGALQPMEHSLRVSVKAERSGHYGGAPLKSIQLTLRPERMPDVEPIS